MARDEHETQQSLRSLDVLGPNLDAALMPSAQSACQLDRAPAAEAWDGDRVKSVKTPHTGVKKPSTVAVPVAAPPSFVSGPRRRGPAMVSRPQRQARNGFS